MNRTKDKSIATEVKRRISKGGSKKFWTFENFADLDPGAVAATLSRLSRTGEIRRARRGVYYLPRQTAFGESRPDPTQLADVILRKGSGVPSSEYARLGLTTQAPGALTRAVSRRMRIKDVRGIPLRTVTRPLSKQKGIRDEERTALDALRNAHRIPDTSPEKAIARIKTLLRTHYLDFDRLSRFATVEPPRVRALLGAIGEDLKCDLEPVTRLRRSINPLSFYKIPGASKALKHAKEWRIK
jgi:hypothetical protein